MFKNLDRFIGNAVTLFAVVAYFELFKFTMIPFSLRTLSQLAVCGLMIVLIILKLIYQPEKLVRMNFGRVIFIMIIGVIPSYLIADTYHNQSFVISIFASRIIWFYVLYFFVHVYKVSIKFIIQIILYIGLFAVVLYYIQYARYPNIFLDINMLEGRGTIRLFVYGMLCTQVAYFYFLNRFFERNTMIDLILALVSLSIFVLQGTRQLLFAAALLTLINLFFSRRVKGRVVKIGVVTLASLAVFMIFREIFLELTKVSSSQMGDLTGGVRIKASRFFLTSFQPSGWSYLFGNGVAGSGSMYSSRMSLYAFKYGFYLSDIGVIGDYIKYGIVFVLAGLYMLAKSILFKVSPEYRYLKYYIVMQCFTLVTGYGILGGVDVVLLLILYVFDVDRANYTSSNSLEETGSKTINHKNEQTNSIHYHPHLQ